MQSNSTEVVEYRSVEGFPGYRVGNDGSVWSCWKLVGAGMGKGTKSLMTDRWKQMKPGTDRGYRYVKLRVNGHKKHLMVHRLVLDAFVGPRPAGMQCRHFPDNTRSNNRISNLSWGTPKANAADRAFHDTQARGEKQGCAKLTANNVADIRQRYRNGGITQRELGEEYGVSQVQIGRIVNRKWWRHL